MYTLTIAEIGINYAYGSNKSLFLENAKQLIDVAKLAGFDYVKFQKRNPDIAVPEHQKLKQKIVPWRTEETTYIQYKKDIEWSIPEYAELVSYAHDKNIGIFSSVWDKDSVDAMAAFGTRTHAFNKKNNFSSVGSHGVIMKIPSPHLTNVELLKYAREKADILMLSTGMSTEEDIEIAVKEGNPDVIFHTNSTYPAPVDELNLNYIKWLKEKYPDKQIFYSGHEYGLTTTFAAMLLGAEGIERHVTLGRTNFGSDQLASVETIGMLKLIKGLRELESSLGDGGPREILQGELSKLKSLRG